MINNNLITSPSFLLLFFISSYVNANDVQNWDDSIEKTIKETFKVETFVDGFDIPWGMAFLPNQNLIVSDKNGNLWQVDYNKKKKTQIVGVPNVRNKGQGGLLDVQVHPDFINNHYIYLGFTSYLKRRKNKTFTSIVRARLKNNSLIDQKIIYKADDIYYSGVTVHYGTRIVFDKEGYLYFSIGDRGRRDQAQLLDYPNGKIHRLHDDGSIPTNNPFIQEKNAIKSIWTYGNRNPQGLAIHPVSSIIFETEHGPKGGDELNILSSGNNYGWPEITYGKNYSGTTITKYTHKKGMEQPVIHWTPSIAVCGIDFYDGELFKNWENNLLVSSLKFENLYRLEIKDNKVTEQEIVYRAGSRIRDVETGPEGFIYLALEDPGRIVRFIPIKN
ncbi:MAG: PQQ-dependent sugar dehydrogenase [Candidatus Neomarinimicrobiota bacterium]|nr:PQQ-dependent sugar dehydrogenase [Candidatus Neomarinimicrobiota bacterium]